MKLTTYNLKRDIQEYGIEHVVRRFWYSDGYWKQRIVCIIRLYYRCSMKQAWSILFSAIDNERNYMPENEVKYTDEWKKIELYSEKNLD